MSRLGSLKSYPLLILSELARVSSKDCYMARFEDGTRFPDKMSSYISMH